MSSPRFTHLFIDEEVRQITGRGYVDFDRLFQMHQAGPFFVTRAKSNTNARCVYSAMVVGSLNRMQLRCSGYSW